MILRTKVETALNNGYYLFALRLVTEAIKANGETPWLNEIIRRYSLNVSSVELAKDVYPRLDDFNYETINSREFNRASTSGLVVCSFDDGDVDLPLPESGAEHYAFNSTIKTRKKRDLIRIPNASISIDFSKAYGYQYYIFNEDGNYLEEISNGNSPFLQSEEVIEYNKSVGFIDDRFTKFNICHLLFDKLPRIFELQKYFDKIDEYILLSTNAYTDDLANMLNVVFSNIRSVNGVRVTIKLSELLLTSSSSYSVMHPAQLGYEFLPLLAATLKKSIKKERIVKKNIFISRERAETRRILNNVEFMVVIEEFNFEIINLEDFTLVDKISIFQNANVVLGIYGAGLTHLMFCEKGTKIIEILPPKCATPTYWVASRTFDLDYNSFIAYDEGVIDYKEWAHQPALHNRDDLTINCDAFREFLKKELNKNQL